jgi:anti-sigma B factor antagonist
MLLGEGQGSDVRPARLQLAQGFRVSCQEKPTASVIKVAGDIDLSTIDHFSGALESGWARPGADVIVDLEELTFIDAAGLGALVRAHRVITSQNGREMIFHNVPPPAHRLFDITGLSRVFDIRSFTWR